MEESRSNKEVKMGVMQGNNKDNEAQQKYSYEDLNRICSELYQQNLNLQKELQQMNMINMFKRLDYLFKVVDICHKEKPGDTYYPCFSPDFVENCIAEIQEAMTVPAEQKETPKE